MMRDKDLAHKSSTYLGLKGPELTTVRLARRGPRKSFSYKNLAVWLSYKPLRNRQAVTMRGGNGHTTALKGSSNNTYFVRA